MLHGLKRGIPVLVLLGMLGTLGAPIPADAGVKGRRNTAIGLTAATIYELARGHGGTALILGAGSAYAWKRTQDAKKHKVYTRKGYRR